MADWAAIISGESAEDLGAAGPASEIPGALRRRLPPFSRDVARCALPLLRVHPQTTVIFTGTNGDLESTVTLLTDLARGEMLSPALFAFSVHNAPPGALSLCLKPTGDHTALASGDDALAGALTEAYARLATGEAEAVLLIHAEQRPPEIYQDLEGDSDAAGVFLAARLSPSTNNGGAADLTPGRAGVVALARALQAGARRIRFTPPSVEALAA